MVKKIIPFLSLLILISCKGTGKYTDLQSLTIGILSTDDYNLPPTLINDSIGLKVNVIRFETSLERNNALTSGKIDGITTDFLDAAILEATGIPLQIVMKNDSNFQLITGIGKNIRSLDLLKGRNIAVEKNTIIEYLTDRILESANIPTDTGVNKADIKRTSLRLNLLQNGLIDGAVLPGKYAKTAVEQGNYSLFSLQETNIPAIVTLFSANALNEKPKEIKIFVEEHKTSRPSNQDMKNVNQWLKQKKLIS